MIVTPVFLIEKSILSFTLTVTKEKKNQISWMLSYLEVWVYVSIFCHLVHVEFSTGFDRRLVLVSNWLPSAD